LSTNRIRTAFVVSLAGLVAGCGGTTKFSGSTVALDITSDGSLTGVAVEQLAVTVSGADTTTFSVPATAGLAAGQAQTLVYNAVAGSGTLDFAVAAMAHGTPAAMGAGTIDVKRGGAAVLDIVLSAVAPPDMASEPADMAMPGDLATPPRDLTGVIVYDLLGVDLAHGPIVPSNTVVPYNPAAADLSGVVGIDTTALQLAIAGGAGNDGGTLAAPPSGVGFVVDGSFAVLTVGKWTVDKEVRVSGSRALIVVAKSVAIKNVIHAEAVGGVAGPGGFAALLGPGHGTNGGTGSFFGTPTGGGGGGAGHGSAGANGGNGLSAGPGVGGPTYNLTPVTDLSGGSGGGTGGASCGPGGAGGGALQISANEDIAVELSGVVNAGGGGAQAANCSGAGSGGTILFEARAITVRGVLSANGGNFAGDAIVGRGRSGSSFGAGATVDDAAKVGSLAFPRAFGGGGGYGRIALRTSGPYGADVLAASAISPAPAIDTSVP